MTASRGLTISGSGTVSTRTSCRPCQVSARMTASSGFFPIVVGGDLAGFHEHLQALELAAALHRGHPLERRGDPFAQRAVRRNIGNERRNLCAPAGWRVAEHDLAARPDVGAVGRTPGDLLVL